MPLRGADGRAQDCSLVADRAPVVVLCLGADVELSFWQDRAVAREREMEALAPAASVVEEVDGPDTEAMLPDETAQTDPGADDELGVDVPRLTPAQGRHGSAGGRTKRAKNKKGKEKVSPRRTEKDEALMVTLVHGDILVASGGVFEVCIRAFCCIGNKLIL